MLLLRVSLAICVRHAICSLTAELVVYPPSRSSSLCLSICVLCCVCMLPVAVSDRAVLCAVLFNSVVMTVGYLRLSVSRVDERVRGKG
jgi:hypothetical protein